MNDVQIDSIVNGSPHGPFANFLLNAAVGGKLDPGLLRPYIKTRRLNSGIEIPIGAFCNSAGREVMVQNATLRKDEWKQMDDVLVATAKMQLGAVQDLISRGLTYSLKNPLGTTILETETVGEMPDAEVNMDAVVRAEQGRVEFEIGYLPLPIVHSHFQINARVLNASRTRGEALDTTQTRESTVKVMQKIEEILFDGIPSFAYGGGSVYGYTNFPSRITGNLTGAWNALTPTSTGSVGEQILEDVKLMMQAARNAYHRGPFGLYIPTGWEYLLDDDYVPGYPKTIRVRLLELGGLELVRGSDFLDDEVVLVQLTPDVARMVMGMTPTVLQDKAEFGLVSLFKVMAIMVPQVRADQNGNTGIVHYSVAV